MFVDLVTIKLYLRFCLYCHLCSSILQTIHRLNAENAHKTLVLAGVATALTLLGVNFCFCL